MECAVLDAIEDYPPETLNDPDDCKDSVRAATIPYNQLRDLVNGTLIRPPQGIDEAEINQIKEDKETIRKIFP